ncbi:MAG TPA: response regulator [Rhizomicrobium sp.]
MTNETYKPTILVVEDESIVRMLAVSVFEDEGFEVVEAANGKQALGVLLNHPEICVLFTDINMPGELDGFDLARKIHAQRPDIRLVLTSGKVAISDIDIPEGGVFISKPYSPDAVARLVSRILN